jgi:hypothetical protein
MTIHNYKVEKTHHFQCGDCKAWWKVESLAHWPQTTIPRGVVYCPACGSGGEYVEKKEKDNKG